MKVKIDFKETIAPGGTVVYESPVLQRIRTEAKAQGWSTMAGIKEYCKTTYGATLRSGSDNNWTSVTFDSEEQFQQFLGDSK